MIFTGYFDGKKGYAILFLLYLVSNFLMLLNVDGMYWDDWWILGVEQSTLDQVFYQLDGHAGAVRAKMIGFLSQVGNGVLVFRVLTFVLYFGVVLCVYKILQTISALSKEDVFFITLIFMVAPLNSARALAVSVFPYAVSLSLFFFGFYLLSKNIKTNIRLPNRLLILALFFFSFLTNSLLVFYAIPLMYIFYQMYWSQDCKILSSIKEFAKKNVDFILLPFLFFIVKELFFKSSGINADYNSFDLHMILSMPITILVSFYSSFLEPISQSFATFLPFWIFAILVFLVSFGTKGATHVESKKRSLYFLVLGGVFFVLAVVPYLAVSKLPQLGDFASRHQLLIPLGFSFILYFSIKIFFSENNYSKKLMIRVLMIFVLMFTAQNIYTNYQYKLDWFYQVGLEENIKDLDVFRENTTFIVSMESDILKLRSIINSGEHSHRLKKIFGDDARFMMDRSEVETGLSTVKKQKISGSSSWVPQKPVHIRITKGRFHRKLFFYEFFNKEKFKFLAKKLIHVEQVSKI